MNICAREGCDIEFIRKTHNQKYHDDECCRLATNKRVKEKYHQGQARKKGRIRWCEVCGKTRLSRYNDTLVCAPCRSVNELKANKSALNMLLGASITA